MWSFRLPSLRDRREDIEANLLFELARSEHELGVRVGFNSDAMERYLAFARDPATIWPGNFRDFSSSIRRLCTLAPRGRITRSMVDGEIEALQEDWSRMSANDDLQLIEEVMGAGAGEIDPFDMVQLAEVIRVCRSSPSISAAGRRLFSVSRAKRMTLNDADRLRKYLARFDLEWGSL